MRTRRAAMARPYCRVRMRDNMLSTSSCDFFRAMQAHRKKCGACGLLPACVALLLANAAGAFLPVPGLRESAAGTAGAGLGLSRTDSLSRGRSIICLEGPAFRRPLPCRVAPAGAGEAREGTGEAWLQRKISVLSPGPGESIGAVTDLVARSFKEVEQYRVGLVNLQVQTAGHRLSQGVGAARTSTISLPLAQVDRPLPHPAPCPVDGQCRPAEMAGVPVCVCDCVCACVSNALSASSVLRPCSAKLSWAVETMRMMFSLL